MSVPTLSEYNTSYVIQKERIPDAKGNNISCIIRYSPPGSYLHHLTIDNVTASDTCLCSILDAISKSQSLRSVTFANMSFSPRVFEMFINVLTNPYLLLTEVFITSCIKQNFSQATIFLERLQLFNVPILTVTKEPLIIPKMRNLLLPAISRNVAYILVEPCHTTRSGTIETLYSSLSKRVVAQARNYFNFAPQTASISIEVERLDELLNQKLIYLISLIFNIKQCYTSVVFSVIETGETITYQQNDFFSLLNKN